MFLAAAAVLPQVGTIDPLPYPILRVPAKDDAPSEPCRKFSDRRCRLVDLAFSWNVLRWEIPGALYDPGFRRESN